jgi:uncharacterized protein YqhQ
MKESFYYGGQAVIEGVMMRGRTNIAISVYRPDGSLDLHQQPVPNVYKGSARKIPLLRGMLVFAEALTLGIQSLFHSAQISSLEEEEKVPALMLWGIVAASLAFAVGLFFITPLLITRYLDIYISSDLVSNLFEGILRIFIFIAYLFIIGHFPDIKRIYRYHGAEHKVINAYEAGCPLTEEEVQKYSTAHIRCGTSFIFAVMVVTILIFAFLGRPSIWLSILSRVAFLPLIAGIGYEVTRLGARYNRSKAARMLLAPGLLLQSLTTKEPGNHQLKAAISSLKAVIEADNQSMRTKTYTESSVSNSR